MTPEIFRPVERPDALAIAILAYMGLLILFVIYDTIKMLFEEE